MKCRNSFWLLHNWRLLILEMPFPGKSGCRPGLLLSGSLRCLGFQCYCVFSQEKICHLLPTCKRHSHGTRLSSPCFDFRRTPSEAAIWGPRVLRCAVLCLAHRRLTPWSFLGALNQKLSCSCSLWLWVLIPVLSLPFLSPLPHFSSFFLCLSSPTSSVHLSPWHFAPNSSLC